MTGAIEEEEKLSNGHISEPPSPPHAGQQDDDDAAAIAAAAAATEAAQVETIIETIREAPPSAAAAGGPTTTTTATSPLPPRIGSLSPPPLPSSSPQQQQQQQHLGDEFDEGTYWDLPSMAPLSAASAAAVARLRAYRPPPFPLWDRLPLSRRAAVLILLYADRRGNLRVVLTMRAATLRSFSGHAAFPGGKADTLEETPYQIARREAWEEIGLPIDDTKIPAPFRIEHLCCLPHSLAKTELAVRPCVALLHSDDQPGAPAQPSPTVDESLMPRLDPKEVAAVFSGPLHNFLLAEDEVLPGDREKGVGLPPGKWYEGKWIEFKHVPWRAHYFYVPVTHQRVTKPREREDGLAALAESVDEGGEEGEEEEPGRYMVWGMTGRMLVDTARIAYGEEPAFEHNKHFGDEALLEKLAGAGQLYEKKRRPEGEVAPQEVKKAKEGSKM